MREFAQAGMVMEKTLVSQCRACGRGNRASARFCTGCGGKLPLRARFVLSGQEIADGFAAAGRVPQERDWFAGLPAASGHLPAVLAGPDGNLAMQARRVFETLARPRFSLSFADLSVAEGSGDDIRIAADDVNTFVTLAPTASGDRIIRLGNREDAVALLVELLGTSEGADPGSPFSLTLAALDLAALAAIAQQARLDDFRAGAEGQAVALDRLVQPITGKDVAAWCRAERMLPDPGSPLRCLAVACGGGLLEALEGQGAEKAVGRLAGYGLADADGVLNGQGRALVGLLKRSRISLLRSTSYDNAETASDSMLLLHGRGGALAGEWQADAAGKRLLSFRARQGEEWLRFVDARLGPLLLQTAEGVSEGGGVCPICTMLYQELPRFCRECGARLYEDPDSPR